MKQLVENTSLGQFWLTWSLEQWTQFDLDHLDKSSDQIILYLVRYVRIFV